MLRCASGLLIQGVAYPAETILVHGSYLINLG